MIPGPGGPRDQLAKLEAASTSEDAPPPASRTDRHTPADQRPHDHPRRDAGHRRDRALLRERAAGPGVNRAPGETRSRRAPRPRGGSTRKRADRRLELSERTGRQPRTVGMGRGRSRRSPVRRRKTPPARGSKPPVVGRQGQDQAAGARRRPRSWRTGPRQGTSGGKGGTAVTVDYPTGPTDPGALVSPTTDPERVGVVLDATRTPRGRRFRLVAQANGQKPFVAEEILQSGASAERGRRRTATAVLPGPVRRIPGSTRTAR